MQLGVPVALLRHKGTITTVLYVIACLLCVYLLYDIIFTPIPTKAPAETKKDDFVYSMFGGKFEIEPKPEAETVIHLPFAPRRHSCVTLFEKAERNFSYSEFFWEHSDAYKSALAQVGKLKEASVDEISWIFHDLALMPFIETVCETGFRAGHYSFHFLTAKPEVVVYSFESQHLNFTEDMATFFTAEFPDRFYFYGGDTVKTIPKFHKQNNKTTCDLLYIETAGRSNEEVEKDFVNMVDMRHPKQTLIAMLSYSDADAADGLQLWNRKVKEGKIFEQFTCDLDKNDKYNDMYEFDRRNDLHVKKLMIGMLTDKNKKVINEK